MTRHSFFLVQERHHSSSYDAQRNSTNCLSQAGSHSSEMSQSDSIDPVIYMGTKYFPVALPHVTHGSLKVFFEHLMKSLMWHFLEQLEVLKNYYLSIGQSGKNRRFTLFKRRFKFQLSLLLNM